MTVRRAGAVAGIVLALLLPLMVVTTSQAAAPVPWTLPQAVPGTAGLVNPQSATAPDGTDLVLWGAAGAVSPQNVVKAKVRLPGRSAWVKIPVRLKGDYLGVSDIVGTPQGDFWAVYSSGASNDDSFIVRLDTRAHRWTKPTRLFTSQAAYSHAAPQVGLSGDGTLVVATYAPPAVPPAGDPVYRIAVTTKKPGGRWSSRFLSPVDKMATGHVLSVNRAGDILISFIQGYDLADMTVRAAAKAHGKHKPWKVGTLSAAGDSQRVRSSLAADGTAAVVWSSPASSPFTAVRLATRDIRTRLDPWVGRDVVAATSVDTDAYVLAGRHGSATAFWRTTGASNPIWSRHFDGSSLGSPVQVTPTGEIAEFDALVARPDGKAFLVYQRFTPAIFSLGLEVRTLVDGVASDPVTLTGDETTFGNTNSEQLSVDAAGRGMLMYTFGDYPDTNFSWQAQLAPPAAMTGSSTGVVAHRARITGATRVGRTVTCTAGYWVEASSITYRWTRDGHPIAGATRARYDIARADAGKQLACRVVGSNADGEKTVLTSKRTVVGR